VIEVASSSLEQDRQTKARIYAAGGVAIYWVVNLVDRRVEVYSEPSGSVEPIGYRHCEIIELASEVTVVIDGAAVGRIRVADLLP
jgi:Uma2 family endonuclease